MQEFNKNLHCGFVAILGRPNVGKSTLLNYILGEKISIISATPQTTRFQIRGIFNDKRGQIVFVDTPGMHISKDKLGRFLNNMVLKAKEDADLILYMVDLTRFPAKEEEIIMKELKKSKVPLIMVLNKMDKGAGYVSDYIRAWEKIKVEKDPLVSYIPISSTKGKNIEELLATIFSHLPAGPRYYPEEILSDFPQRLAIADIIREKFLQFLREELPHSLAVLIEELQPRSEKLTYIKASILVDKESHKQMVIGKEGQLIKRVGQLSRKEIEEFLEKKVYLDLWVKVERKWQENPFILKRLGYFI